ncbi:MAG TPA: hypothetical protein VIL20_30370 [Sandaracinaceae bacterium]
MSTRSVLLALALLASFASSARADELASVTLAPWSSYDGVDRPYRFIVEMRPRGAEPIEVVADRRLLSFTVRPNEGRRRYPCRHPQAQRRVAGGRVRTLTPGAEGEDGVWREWIDLRMYCTGRALAALGAGASVEARYGWPRRARTRWIARRPGSPWREWTGGVDLAPIAFPAQPAGATRPAHGEGEPPIELALAPSSARTGAGLILRPSVRAREGAERVYVRPDAFSFHVRGPLGDATCRIESGGGSPPPDLYRRITTRVAVRASLDAAYFCPEGTFLLAGVYEVTPEVRLSHSGEEWGLDAVTGRFVGPTVAIRITHGERGYVEQVPEPAEAPRDE